MILILSMVLATFTACTGGQEKPNSQENQNGSRELPKILPEMEEKILEIMYALDSIPGIGKALFQREILEIETRVESDVDHSQEEKESIAKKHINPQRFISEESAIICVLEEEEVKPSIVKVDQLPSDIDDAWYEISKVFYQIHRQWNVLEVHLGDGGISAESVELGRQSLNQATLYMEEKDVLNSLYSLNSLMYYLSLYRSHYLYKIPHEIYELKYGMRQACLLAFDGRFDESITITKQAMELVNQLRPGLIEKDAQTVLQKLDFSLLEMQEEGNLREYHLLKMKAAVTMKNIALATAPFEAQGK